MKTWLEISRSAVEDAVMSYRRLAGESHFFAVIKSNAYGHGLAQLTEILKPLIASGEVRGVAVNSVEEALQVRRLDLPGPVLIMGRNTDLSYNDIPANESDFHLVLSTRSDVEALVTIRPDLPFHIKIDTGMSRLGVHGESWDQLKDYLKSQENLSWYGMMTHFANVEDVMDQGYGRRQLSAFDEAIKEARTLFSGVSRFESLVCHSAASAPALLLPESRQDWIRVGISLYGFWPSQSTRLSARTILGETMPNFRPALSWKSRIVHINPVGEGVDIGYGCTFRTSAPTKVAVVPVGYFEGYDRSLSNRAHVLIRGRRAQVLGRVCMNMIMVDATAIVDAAPGDVVTLIGNDGKESVTADELADLAGTINYELVTRIQQDLPRIIVD